jgi:hypothetical protein
VDPSGGSGRRRSNEPLYGLPPGPGPAVPISGPGYPPREPGYPQQHVPISPPTAGYPAAPSYSPASPVFERGRSRAVPLVIGIIAVLLLLGGGAVLSAAFRVGPAANLLADSGVESCKAIAAQKSASNPNNTSGPVGKTTVADYRKARAQFTNSRYADLRTAGAHFLDVVWQAQSALGNGPDASFGALAFLGPLLSAYSDLAGACANHGAVLPPLSTG